MSRSFMYHVAVLSFQIEHSESNAYEGLGKSISVMIS